MSYNKLKSLVANGGSDKDSVTNPHSRQTSHTRGKKPYPNIPGVWRYQRSAEHRQRQACSGDMGRTDKAVG